MIYYIDSASMYNLQVSSSAVISGTINVFTVLGSGSTIMTISGASGPLLEVRDTGTPSNDLFIVSSASVDLFTINKSGIVNVSGTLNVSSSVSASSYSGSTASASYAISASNATTASYALTISGAATTITNYTGSSAVGGMIISGNGQFNGNFGALGSDLWNPGTTPNIYKVTIVSKDTADGTIPNNAFMDELTCYVTVAGPPTVNFTVRTSWTIIGTPGARTYSNNNGALKLAIATGTTWYVDLFIVKNHG